MRMLGRGAEASQRTGIRQGIRQQRYGNVGRSSGGLRRPFSARPCTSSPSLQEIGRKFGGRHHNTVRHSIKKVERMRRTDEMLDRTITG